MNTVKLLVDSAAKVCRNKSGVARSLGLRPQDLYGYEKGSRHMPAHLLIRLATLANANAVMALGRYEAEWAGKKTQRAAAGIAVADFSLVALSLAHGDAKATSVNTLMRGSPTAHYAQLRRWFLRLWLFASAQGA